MNRLLTTLAANSLERFHFYDVGNRRYLPTTYICEVHSMYSAFETRSGLHHLHRPTRHGQYLARDCGKKYSLKHIIILILFPASQVTNSSHTELGTRGALSYMRSVQMSRLDK